MVLDGSWFLFDDQTVKEVDAGFVMEEAIGGVEKVQVSNGFGSSEVFETQKDKSAYMLFYKRATLVLEESSKSMEVSMFLEEARKDIAKKNREIMRRKCVMDKRYFQFSWDFFDSVLDQQAEDSQLEAFQVACFHFFDSVLLIEKGIKPICRWVSRLINCVKHSEALRVWCSSFFHSHEVLVRKWCMRCPNAQIRGVLCNLVFSPLLFEIGTVFDNALLDLPFDSEGLRKDLPSISALNPSMIFKLSEDDLSGSSLCVSSRIDCLRAVSAASFRVLSKNGIVSISDFVNMPDAVSRKLNLELSKKAMEQVTTAVSEAIAFFGTRKADSPSEKKELDSEARLSTHEPKAIISTVQLCCSIVHKLVEDDFHCEELFQMFLTMCSSSSYHVRLLLYREGFLKDLLRLCTETSDVLINSTLVYLPKEAVATIRNRIQAVPFKLALSCIQKLSACVLVNSNQVSSSLPTLVKGSPAPLASSEVQSLLRSQGFIQRIVASKDSDDNRLLISHVCFADIELSRMVIDFGTRSIIEMDFDGFFTGLRLIESLIQLRDGLESQRTLYLMPLLIKCFRANKEFWKACDLVIFFIASFAKKQASVKKWLVEQKEASSDLISWLKANAKEPSRHSKGKVVKYKIDIPAEPGKKQSAVDERRDSVVSAVKRSKGDSLKELSAVLGVADKA